MRADVVRAASRGRAGCAPRCAARVADHAGRAAGQRERPVAGELEAAQPELAHQVADVQRVGGRIEADVDADRSARRGAARARLVGRVVDEPTGVEVGERGPYGVTMLRRARPHTGSHSGSPPTNQRHGRSAALVMPIRGDRRGVARRRRAVVDQPRPPGASRTDRRRCRRGRGRAPGTAWPGRRHRSRSRPPRPRGASRPGRRAATAARSSTAWPSPSAPATTLAQ